MQKEIRIRKANKVLRVSENEVAKYTAVGYDVIDDKGNVVQASVPHDPNILRKAFVEKSETIDKLNAEITQLKAEIKTLKAQADKSIKQTQKQRNKRNDE